jgi:hypothetical protein
MDGAELALFGFGYPASIAVITRFPPVVRERRWKWLAVHHLGVAAIIAGWVSKRGTVGVLSNTGWLVVSTAWYVAGGRGRKAGAVQG